MPKDTKCFAAKLHETLLQRDWLEMLADVAENRPLGSYSIISREEACQFYEAAKWWPCPYRKGGPKP